MLDRSANVELRFAPLPAVERVHGRARLEAEFVRLLRELFERERFEAIGGKLAADPARILDTHHERRRLTAADACDQIAIAAGHRP